MLDIALDTTIACTSDCR